MSTKGASNHYGNAKGGRQGHLTVHTGFAWAKAFNRTTLQKHFNEHGHEFNGKGISNDDIPGYVLEAVYQGKIVGTQGKRSPRAVYEFTYNGEIHRIAVQVSDNGYIVGANLKGTKGK